MLCRMGWLMGYAQPLSTDDVLSKVHALGEGGGGDVAGRTTQSTGITGGDLCFTLLFYPKQQQQSRTAALCCNVAVAKSRYR